MTRREVVADPGGEWVRGVGYVGVDFSGFGKKRYDVRPMGKTEGKSSAAHKDNNGEVKMLRQAICLILGMALLSGCASVKVQKIPDPSTYLYPGTDGSPVWNERQAQADEIRGVRYYLPRPYVLVKKEFPVDGGTFLLRGTLDAKQNLALNQDLPAVVAELFAASPESQVVPLDGAKFDASGTASQQKQETESGTTDSADSKPAKEERPKLLLDSNDLLKDSAPSEKEVSDPKATIRLAIKVSKDLEAKLELGDNETLGTDKVYLVPFQNGKHLADKVVEATVYKSEGSAGKDRTLLAQIEGSKVPTFAALGVKVRFEKDGKSSSVILHRKDFDILSVFSSDSTTGDDGDKPKDDEGDKKKPSTKNEAKDVKGATASISGDPSTDPLMYESDLYDILLLPDFSEQYAIRVRSGLFQAKADIGLENGWMLEKFGVDIDNSAIGDFVLDTAGKIVDLGLKDVFDVAESLEAAEGAEEATDELESATVGTPVTVRVDWIDYAVPGPYPIPKFSEACCPQGIDCVVENLCVPKVKYETRRQIAITIVEFGDNPSDTAPAPSGNTTRILDQAEVEAALKTIEDQAFLQIFDNGKPAVCGSLALTQEADGNWKGDLAFPKGSVSSDHASRLEAHRDEISAAIKKVANIQAEIFLSFKTCD